MNKQWWKASLVRAIRTIAQTALASIGTEVMFDEINWSIIISAALFAGLLSMLTSLTGLPEVDS